jgi:hypothetical protein
VIPQFESLLPDLARALARAGDLGPEGATTLARVLTIIATLVLGWIAYRLTAGVIHRVLRPLEGAANDMVLRLHARVDATAREGLGLELRRRVKDALEGAGIWTSQRRKESPA